MTDIPEDIMKAANEAVTNWKEGGTQDALMSVIARALMAERERWQDKVEGLECDLESAVEVAFNRGATEWTRLNYPKLNERLSKAQ